MPYRGRRRYGRYRRRRRTRATSYRRKKYRRRRAFGRFARRVRKAAAIEKKVYDGFQTQFALGGDALGNEHSGSLTPLGTGTGDGQRIGNKIKPLMVYLKIFAGMNTRTVTASRYIRVLVVQCYSRFGVVPTMNTWVKQGGASNNPQFLQYLRERDPGRVLWDKIIKVSPGNLVIGDPGFTIADPGGGTKAAQPDAWTRSTFVSKVMKPRAETKWTDAGATTTGHIFLYIIGSADVDVSYQWRLHYVDA